MNRRNFLRGIMNAACGVVALGTVMTVAACSTTGGTAAPTMQLNWVYDFAAAGPVLAEVDKYFAKTGAGDVQLQPGGSNIAPDPIVASGKALVGVSSPEVTAAANKGGANLKIVAATLQSNPYTVLSLAGDPIRRPQDLVGKTIAVEPTAMTPWRGFLAVNGIDPESVKTVPPNYDLSLLTTGKVDGYLAFVTNDEVTLKTKGVDYVSMPFDKNGYPSVGETIMVDESSLTSRRDEVKKLIHAVILGWQAAAADPSGTASVIVDHYGESLGLTLDDQTAKLQAMAPLIIVPGTTNRVLQVTPDRASATVESLRKAGVPVDVDGLFDLSIVDEIYAENPEIAQ